MFIIQCILTNYKRNGKMHFLKDIKSGREILLLHKNIRPPKNIRSCQLFSRNKCQINFAYQDEGTNLCKSRTRIIRNSCQKRVNPFPLPYFIFYFLILLWIYWKSLAYASEVACCCWKPIFVRREINVSWIIKNSH